VVLDGLAFGEGPRWRGDQLWFSDMHDDRVLRYTPRTGALDDIAHVPGKPSGLGWDVDDALLVVSMDDRRLLRWGGNGVDDLSEVADLSSYTDRPINDMVVSPDGRHAFIGGFGFDLHVGEQPRPTVLLAVDTSTGSHRAVADGMSFPNGMVITPDGATLIVGESMAAQLTAFAIGGDGSLHDRRVWAPLAPAFPDGICLDAEGCVWVASPGDRACLRVREGGEVVDRVSTGDQMAIACALGGDDGRTLFICTSRGIDPAKARERRTGCIETVVVDVPGAGSP
jgi:sugar lactone lactonase YvrE